MMGKRVFIIGIVPVEANLPEVIYMNSLLATI